MIGEWKETCIDLRHRPASMHQPVECCKCEKSQLVHVSRTSLFWMHFSINYCIIRAAVRVNGGIRCVHQWMSCASMEADAGVQRSLTWIAKKESDKIVQLIYVWNFILIMNRNSVRMRVELCQVQSDVFSYVVLGPTESGGGLKEIYARLQFDTRAVRRACRCRPAALHWHTWASFSIICTKSPF